MYKIPAKYKNTISAELKKFIPLIHSLQAKGKKSSEDDARILLNDILSYALGYDKYNELKTELREKNGRFDYVVKLSEGPNSKKPDRFDFVIEAKAAHIKLSQAHIDQTLSYCLSKGLDYFILTNAVVWQLFKVKHSKKCPEAHLVHEVDFGCSNNIDSLSEEFYLFSKAAYLQGNWKSVSQVVKVTQVEDIVAVLLSDKIIRSITKELTSNSGVKVSPELIKDIVENQIVRSAVQSFNSKLLKKFNSQTKKTKMADGLLVKSDCSSEKSFQLSENEQVILKNGDNEQLKKDLVLDCPLLKDVS